MKSIAVIYWSGTGNTKMMAEAIAEGAKNDEVMVTLMEVSSASIEDLLNADAVALGCPAMGDEVLEESEMEPFVATIEKEGLNGKPVALFGSYGWGDGEWMIDWADRMKKAGAMLVDDGLIIQEAPDEQGLESCRELGRRLAFM
ncbi:MAG: Flavodoxin [Pelotomaculum sp. PtaU1.Bin035]|nr:MAG: Flavodoxin [Pelotomaculum sp. PtaU1.Bin035]